MFTIKEEAKYNYKLPTDLDQFRYKYLEKDSTSNMSVIFPSFSIDTLEKNRYKLLSASKSIPFMSGWNQRPDYASYDLYNTVIYWSLILFLNNIDCIEDFKDLDNIYIPPYTVLIDLVKDRLPSTAILETIPSLEEPNKNTVDQYKSFMLDEYYLATKQAQSNITGITASPIYDISSYSRTDSFILSSVDITNKYVDLIEIPSSASSLVVNINDLSINQSYGLDYILKYTDNNELRRISWDSTSLVNNSDGMGLLISSGDTLNISYTITNSIRI